MNLHRLITVLLLSFAVLLSGCRDKEKDILLDVKNASAEDLKKIDAALTEISASAAQAKEKNLALSNKISELSMSLGASQAKIDDLSSRVDTLQGMLKASKSRMAEADKKLADQKGIGGILLWFLVIVAGVVVIYLILRVFRSRNEFDEEDEDFADFEDDEDLGFGDDDLEDDVKKDDKDGDLKS